MNKPARLHPLRIANAANDDAIFKLLSDELNSRLGPISRDMEALHHALRQLPRGLRAMAATHPLDHSMALEDLGWHFAHWPSRPIAEETLAGLNELGATEAAQIFEIALSHAVTYWDFICSPKFFDDYLDSALDKAMHPLNCSLWRILGYDGSDGKNLLAYWVPYARAHPELVCPVT
jgi:hypothetical protein